MISWIQRYFQKHFRLVFSIILIAVAVPMVFIYSASGGTGDGKGASKLLDNHFGTLGTWIASTLVKLGDLKLNFLPADDTDS